MRESVMVESAIAHTRSSTGCDNDTIDGNIGDGHTHGGESGESTIRTMMARAVPLQETFKAEIPQATVWLQSKIAKYCGLGTLTGGIAISLFAVLIALWQSPYFQDSWVAHYYIDMYHNDLAFRVLSTYIPAISYSVFMISSIPLSLLVMFDSNLVNKYYLSKRRDNVNGTFWFSFWMITLNHMFLVFTIIVFYPIIWASVLRSDAVGWSKDMSITEEIARNPWMALVFATQFVVNVYLEDFYYYIFHAALHRYKFLYRHIHIYHHKFYPVMAIHGANVHPIEYVLVSLPVLLASITTLSHFRITFILTAWRQLVNADTHSGFHHPAMDKIYRYIPFMNGADSHDYHHYMVVGNYSTFSDGGIDKFFGTEAKGYPKFKTENIRKRAKLQRLEE